MTREKPILFSAPMIRAILDGRKCQTRRILNLSRSVGEPDVPPGHVLDLIYPGSVQHYGYVTPAGRRPMWRVQRLCDASCAHTDVGQYNGRHAVAWGPMPYAPGDRLWCKETWGIHAFGDETDWCRGSVRGSTQDSLRAQYAIAYRADWGPLQEGCFWRPAIFLPRWASRIQLEVSEVRVQRLQDISGEDAEAEGVSVPRCECDVCLRSSAMCTADASAHIEEFAALWDSINGKPSPMLNDDGEPVLDDDGRPRMVASRSWASNPWVLAISFRRMT